MKFHIHFRRRRAAVGVCAGLIASIPLATAWQRPILAAVLGAIWGGIYAVVNSRPGQGAGRFLDSALTGATLGIPLWGAVSVYALPSIAGQGRQWTADGMRSAFPALVGWLLSGIALGLLVPLGLVLAERFLGAEPTEKLPTSNARKKQILVLGGGFAGVGVARELERVFRADPTVEFTLVSETNALLFTPMLAEVAASSLEPTHISSPLRTSLRTTRVLRGRVAGFDLGARTVKMERVETGEGASSKIDWLPYDHVVLALGAVSNYLGNDAIRAHSLDFKSLGDAIRVRNAVIAAFDSADAESDSNKRRCSPSSWRAAGFRARSWPGHSMISRAGCWRTIPRSRWTNCG